MAIALLASGAVPQAQAPQPQAPAPAPPPAVDEASTIIEVRALVQQLVSGQTARVVDRFSDKMKAGLSEAELKQVLTTLANQAGPYKSQGDATFGTNGALRQVTITCQFERGAVDVVAHP